ncbi:DUF6214 family protein [Streptomyces sp. NPDC051214]|uniref:DUF6214 family protein n=1 Tax=Streptomyces sp. NPDC051214 TaxID=3155282 RepID=UPI00343FEF49
MLESPFLGVSDHYRPHVAEPPSFHVRLTFGDGAAIDARAVVTEGRITLEGLHASPAQPGGAFPDDPPPAVHRARPAWPRGREGRLKAAQEYRAAQAEGRDPVLAVMRATGRSRRRSLKLIAAARDAGALPARHHRR